jgi:hypothetical protein
MRVARQQFNNAISGFDLEVVEYLPADTNAALLGLDHWCVISPRPFTSVNCAASLVFALRSPALASRLPVGHMPLAPFNASMRPVP